MQINTKSGRKIGLPSDEEEAEINAQINADPEDETLDDEYFEVAQPMAEALPTLTAALVKAQRSGTLTSKPKGRPKSERPKVATTIKVSEFFRATGKGWQTRSQWPLGFACDR